MASLFDPAPLQTDRLPRVMAIPQMTDVVQYVVDPKTGQPIFDYLGRLVAKKTVGGAQVTNQETTFFNFAVEEARRDAADAAAAATRRTEDASARTYDSWRANAMAATQQTRANTHDDYALKVRTAYEQGKFNMLDDLLGKVDEYKN